MFIVERKKWYLKRRMMVGMYIAMECPGCGKIGSLDDHQINDSGVVSPSVECFYKCGFHKNIQLEGWGKEDKPKRILGITKVDNT